MIHVLESVGIVLLIVLCLLALCLVLEGWAMKWHRRKP
jgi:hypothetical protein